MRYTLRPARESDYDFLFALRMASMKEWVTRTWGWDDSFQAAMFREEFDPAHQRVVMVSGRDVGVLAVVQRPDSIFIASIELMPDQQGRGLGTALLSDVLADAHARGLPVSLRVLHVNPAQRLYRRLGFVESGRTETHVLMTALPPAG
jgi:ribosomal protein S18 acetylase RimI-like enzyme